LKSNARVLVCDLIDNEGIHKLKKTGFKVDLKPNILSDELRKTVANYDVLIVRSRTKVTKEILDAGKQLKAVGRVGSGLDNIDLEAAQKKGVKVFNTPEAPAEAVAELTMGLMLALARNIPSADKAMKEGRWIKKDLMGLELKNKTLGTIGLGNVGERVARLARAFGMKILITKRTPPAPALLKELEAEFVSLHELLKRSDIVTIHVLYTPQTHRMIGEKEFQLMKKGSYIINTSRGAIVDEKALLKALQSQRLGGAALDVYEVEPPTNWTLMQLPNVVCTPHIGAQTEEAQKTASVLIAEKIINFFSSTLR
jgi:D-3-phosphoglycerate dehydrogenase